MSGFLQGLDDSQEKSIESLWRNISEWKAELETKVGLFIPASNNTFLQSMDEVA